MKKKITLLMMLAFLGLNIGALRAQNPGAYPGGGGGVQGDPYLVSTVEQMQWIANYVNSGTIGTGAIHCELQNDIDLSSINWVAIGCNGSLDLDDDYTFSGSFDGKNHTVTLKIDATEYADDVVNVGLFGAANGTIKNLTVAGEINGGKYNAAGICCRMRGEILNCHNVAKVISNEGTACGICVHSTHITGSPGVNITDCSNFGSISGIEAYGILGYSSASHYNDHIKNCGNYGTIIGYGMAAGIMGSSDEDVFDRISLCYNFGSIEAGAFAAGIKYGGGGTIFENCFNSGSVTAKGDIEEYPFGIAGGIFCFPEHGQYMEMVGSYNAGIVSGHGIAGGLIGILPELSEGASEDHLFILGSYNIGNVNCGEMEAIPDFDLPAGAYAGSIVGLLLEDRLSFTKVYYDKQMCPVGGVNGVDKTGITPLLTEEMTDPGLDMGEYEVAWGETPLFDIPLFTYTEGLYPQSVFFADEYEEVFSPTALQKAASIVSVTPAFLQNEENVNEVKTDFEVGNENGVTWATTLPFDYDNNGNVSVTGRGAGTLTVSKTEGGITLNKVIDMTSVKCWAGSGTEVDPYKIVDADGLVCLAEKVNAGEPYEGVYFKMMNDIDLSSVCGESVGNWTPIGTAVHPFSGIFDGSEYTIDYLYINNNSSYQGLFGRAVGAIIKNVKIGEHSSVSGSNLVGALVGGYDVDESQAGGVIFENCVNYATVKGYQRVGGLAGSIWNQINDNEYVGQIKNCTNHGTVQSVAYSGDPEETDFVGGLSGEVAFLTEYKYQCQAIGCKNFGTVTNQYNYTGGIFGVIGYNSTVKQCENHGIVTGVGNTGGIMGSVYLPFDELIVESCHNYAQVNASGSDASGVGGIVGGVSLSTVYRQTQVLSSCINEGKVEASGALAVGGVIGLLNTSAQSTPGNLSYLIENCQNQSAVSGFEGVGGVLGACGIFSSSYDPDAISVEGKFMNECSNLGNISGNNYVGGICGCNHFDAYSLHSFGGKITNCENTGKVTTITSNSSVGGIIADGNKIVVSNCTNDGIVSCSKQGYIGGVCGRAMNAKIVECVNNGAISTPAEYIPSVEMGGICGYIEGSNTNGDGVFDCHNHGTVSSADNAGGVVSRAGTITISGCTNDADVKVIYESTGSAGGILCASSGNESSPCIIENCSNFGDVTVGESEDMAVASGVVAECDHTVITKCSNSGEITGYRYASGVAGGGFGTYTITNCFNFGDVTVTTEVEPTIDVFYLANGATIASGIAGLAMGSTVTNCYNCGNISGGSYTAGICGYIDSNENQAVAYCYNTGIIEGNETISMAGGIVGNFSIQDGYVLANNGVQYCYNAGLVKANGVAGGLVAYCEANVSDSYNVGYVSATKVTLTDLAVDILASGGLIGVLGIDNIEPEMTNCYYDKQMCPLDEDYNTVDSPGNIASVTPHTADDNNLLTSVMTNGSWNPDGSAFTASAGLYPQLTAFATSTDAIDNEASLVSVRPMFLAETDNVDHVYTSPFTVGIDDDEEWSHVSGDELLTFKTDGTVEWEDYGTETVAVTNMTHTFITKQIKLTTANAENVTWVDWVTEAPDGFDPANIDSPEDLAWFISYVNGFNGSEVHADADAMITADIDMSAHYWVPIGFYCGNICSEHQITYTGKFLGNFHNIDGIRVDWNALVNSPVLQTLAPVSSGKQNRDGNDYLGMFGSICNDIIVHVFVTSGSIVGDEDYDGGGMGGLVGCAEGSVIWNCYSNASVFQNAGSSKGGLVGVAKVYSGDDKGDDGDGEGVPTVITGSSCTADITGNGEMGGILGWSKGAVIRDCYANVKFTIQDNFGSKGHEFNSQVGCLVGASGKGFVEIYNSYVRMRGYEIIEKGGGEEQAHCVGMIIGEAQGETIDHCYVPADSPYGYVGRSENVKEVFAQVPFDDGSKGDDPIFRLSVKNGGHSYYLMSLDDATDAVFQDCEQVDIEGDTYEIFEPNEEDGHLYIYNDGLDYSFYNSRKGYLAVDGEGQLTYSNATPVLWNVEPNDTYGSFKLYTTPEAEQLYLGMKDGQFGVFAQGTEGCNFDIYAFMSIQMASEANIQNCGKFATTVYPYTYANPEGGNIITLDGDDDEIVESGKTTLLDALNNWDLYHSGDEDISVSMDWARFGSALNGDYPVHCYYNPDNLTEGDAVKPTAKVITTPDKTNGYPFRFYSHVGDALNYYNNLENGGILCVYGSDDMSGAAVQSNDNDVDVYVNGMTYMKCPMNEDASKDWYVSLLQGSGSTLNVHSGFYLDNSDASGEVGGKAYDWHMVSSPLAHVPVGIAYAYETQQPYMTPANCSWDETKDGLFPTDTPLDRYDFYAYSEPDYHWINLKQNSASHYHQDGGNEPIEYTNDTELTAGHGYLIAMDKEVFMQTSGTLNNGTVTVPVTYSGAHNKGLNFLGNPYMSSLDFDEFATANGSLWEGGAYAQSYITLDADKKGYITYAKGQSENPEGLSRYVWPNQGFYIAADKAGTATFTNAMRVIKTDAASYFRGEEPANYALVNLKATDSEGSRDMLTVELGRPEVGGARKVKDVENGNGILYSHYQGGDYSIVFTEEGISQVPVWFESREADSYTMTWSTYNGTFSYLHLIDNLTGCDVDMLTNSEYRFTSSTSDYASRFKLVFEYTGVEEDIDSDADGTFAFQMGEQIVVNGEGTLEIVDVQGRILRSERLSGVQSVVVPSVAKGLYLLRLSGSDSVKVQKIVIK